MHGHHQHAALEHEGELSSDLAGEAIVAAAGLLDERGADVRRVVDLGCGPGVGTAALARRFPGASVVAVDTSPAMLERTAARAAGMGDAGRSVETRLLDLDGDLQSLGRCDLVWAAMSIHHARDEVATLRSLRSLIAPLGLLCVLERAEPLSVRLADDLGRPGIWDRFAEAHRDWYEHVRPRLPGAMNAETYPAMLAEAGLDVVVERPLAQSVEVPRDPQLHGFLAGVLQRSLTNLAGFADEGDLAALQDVLHQPSSSADRWEGAEVAVSRNVFIAETAS